MTALRRFVNRIKDTASEKKKRKQHTHARSREFGRKSFRVFSRIETDDSKGGERERRKDFARSKVENAMISKNESEIWRNPRESSSRDTDNSRRSLLLPPLPPARIFLCRDVGGRGKETRVSLLRRRNVGGPRLRGRRTERQTPTPGITRYIIIYRCCKPRFSVARRRGGFSRRHCPSPIFQIIVSDLGSDLPRAAFYGSIKIPDKLLCSRLAFIDYQAARDARERERERKDREREIGVIRARDRDESCAFIHTHVSLARRKIASRSRGDVRQEDTRG